MGIERKQGIESSLTCKIGQILVQFAKLKNTMKLTDSFREREVAIKNSFLAISRMSEISIRHPSGDSR